MSYSAHEAITHVVVLAGGLGTRIATELGDTPKALAPLGDRTFIDWKLDEFVRNGVTEVTLLLGAGGERVESHLRVTAPLLKIRTRYDGPALKGTGGALLQALGSISDDFFLTYGDTLLDMPYQEVAQARQRAKVRNAMAVTTNIGPADNPNCIVEGGLVIHHSKFHSPDMTATDYGLMLFHPRDVEELALPTSEPVDLSVILGLLAERRKLAATETTDAYWEIGTPPSLQRVRDRLS